jgi:hypothetical protein
VLTNCDQPPDDAKPWPGDVPAPNVSLHEVAPGSAGMRMLGAYEDIVSGAYEGRVRALEATLGADHTIRVGDAACSLTVLRQVPGEDYLSDVETCAWSRLYAVQRPDIGAGTNVVAGCR